MDVHLWARLDLDGKIQSVSSQCSQIPDSPQLTAPLFLPEGPKEVKEGSDKMVPYWEKKDLIKKLDTKLDEMSVIMMEMSSLKTKNGLLEKLITQYEESNHHLKEKVKTLEKELCKYRAGAADIESQCESCSGETTFVRHSQTSVKVAMSVETETTITDLTITPRSECERQELEVDCDEQSCSCNCDVCRNNLSKNRTSGCFDCAATAERPNTLNIELGFGENVSPITSSSGSNSLNSAKDNEIDEVDGYSYAKMNSEDRECTDELRDSRCSSRNLAQSFGNIDVNGYLCFNGLSNGSDESADGCGSTDENFHSYLNVEQLSLKERIGRDQEKDINERSPCANVDTSLQSPTRHRAKEHKYVEIDDGMVCPTNDVSDRAPMPTPRRNRSITNEDTVRPDGTTQPAHRDTRSADLDIRILSTEDMPMSFRCGSSDDSRFFMLPHSERQRASQMRSRSSPDIRNADQLNPVLKDMKTTMEWNHQKREIMERSTTCTVCEAEQTLIKAIQDIHTVFQKVMIGRSKRKTYTSHDIFLKVKRKMKSLEVSDDFCMKCVTLLFSQVNIRSS